MSGTIIRACNPSSSYTSSKATFSIDGNVAPTLSVDFKSNDFESSVIVHVLLTTDTKWLFELKTSDTLNINITLHSDKDSYTVCDSRSYLKEKKLSYDNANMRVAVAELLFELI